MVVVVVVKATTLNETTPAHRFMSTPTPAAPRFRRESHTARHERTLHTSETAEVSAKHPHIEETSEVSDS
jgi:hypothetical protein